MRKLMPVALLLSVGFACCKKSSNSLPNTSVVAPNDKTTTATFSPHIDTFSGVMLTQIGENGFTSDSSNITRMYVNHPTDSTVIITGDFITTEYYDEMSGRATYTTNNFSISFATDTARSYYFNPLDHVYQHISFPADSLYLSIQSSPGSCLFTQLQTFAGRK